MKHKCGRNVVIQVNLENLYSSVGEKVDKGVITLRPTEIIPQSINIIFGELYCLSCKKVIRDFNEIIYSCSNCGNSSPISELCALVPDKKYIRTAIVHKTCIEEHEKYTNRSLPVDEKVKFTIIPDITLEVLEK